MRVEGANKWEKTKKLSDLFLYKTVSSCSNGPAGPCMKTYAIDKIDFTNQGLKRLIMIPYIYNGVIRSSHQILRSNLPGFIGLFMNQTVHGRTVTNCADSREFERSKVVFQNCMDSLHSRPFLSQTSVRNFSTFQGKNTAHLLNIKVDVVFKDFFGNKSSKEVLEKFINLFLGFKGDDQIVIEDFLDPRKMRIEAGKPTTFVDLAVKTRLGERYIIEMQTYNHAGFDKRLLYYLGKDYTEQLEYDSNAKKKIIAWKDLPKVHVIAITSYGILKSKDIVETFAFRPERCPSNGHLFDQWKATIVDLTKFTKNSFDALETEEDRWLFLIKNADKLNEDQVKALKKEPTLKKALEHLENISSDPSKRREYEQRINDLRDEEAVKEAVFEKGIEKGEKKKSIEIAIAMLKDGLPIEQVSKLTGLPVKEIGSLKK